MSLLSVENVIPGTGFEAEPQGFVAGAGRNITYHYFVGMGARSVGNDVHSFDTEEQTFQALSDAGYLQFCRWREGEDMHNWRCGCQDDSGTACRCFCARGVGGEVVLSCFARDVQESIEGFEYYPVHQ